MRKTTAGTDPAEERGGDPGKEPGGEPGGDLVDVPVDGPPVGPGSLVDLDATALVAGGDSLARQADGRVVFISGALGGERVRARITEVRRDYSRAVVEEILVSSQDRVRPSCPEVERGCGGCDLAHLERSAQPRIKAGIVADALRRLGRIEDPVVHEGFTVISGGFRTTVRAAVVDGRAGFRKARSHEVVHVNQCAVAHPGLEELLIEGFFGGASEVTLRIGAKTGERLALVAPMARDVRLPDDVVVVGADELRLDGSRGHTWYHEVVGNRRFRISADSFFQTSAIGAETLVGTVRRMVDDLISGPGLALDAYSGVGLFAACLASPIGTPSDDARRFVAIERNRSSAADARHNLRERHARVMAMAVEDLSSREASALGVDFVVADPSRSGLGRRGVEVLTATEADRLILVSCDPAALGRDARLLAEAGYRFVEAELVDMFPDTHHVEVVSRFDR